MASTASWTMLRRSTTLKPLDSGENSVVFAADGSRLGFIDADIVRGARRPRRDPEVAAGARRSRSRTRTSTSTTALTTARSSRAAFENVEAGEIEQGASTITQQLVRNLYIAKPEDTLERKLHEAKMAMDYEDRYSKRRDPRAVPEHRHLRNQRRRYRGGRRGRLAGVLQQARLRPYGEARPHCSPGCRRRPRSTTRSSTPSGPPSAAIWC